MRIVWLPALLLLPGVSAAADAVLPLRAIRFADAREGWAAGDGGTVLHSIDGGKTWERQPTGTRASLRGLAMLNPYTGFAVGRTELPTGGSAGIVLRTTDGGATWVEANVTPLPGLNAVHFLDESTGFAAGDCTDAFPAGAFRTADGGRTWQALRGPRVGSYSACDCPRADAGLFAYDRGLMRLSGDTLTPLATGAGPVKPLAGLARTADHRVLCVGDAGTVARLADPAGAWATSSAGGAVVDLRAVGVVGESAWAVGRTGKVLFRSADFGQTWQPKPVPTPVPLNAVHMLDAMTGWAAGDLGTIIRTTDGGDSWTLQHAGGQRAAVLFAPARAEAVPLGLVAKLTREGGYHCVAVTTAAADGPRLNAALQSVGGAGADVGCPKVWPQYLSEPIPGRTAESLKELRDPVLLEKLVFLLRVWRPDVVVADAVAPAAPVPDCVGLLHLKEAFTRAADPAAYPDQLSTLGLEVHAAKKLYAVAADGPVAVDLAAFAPEVGESWKDHAEAGYAMLPGRPVPPARVTLRPVAHRAAGTESHADVMQGLDLPPGGTARRPAEARDRDPEAVAARAGWAAVRRDLDALGAKPADRASIAEALAKIGPLPANVACRAAAALGRTYADRGEWTAARELYAAAADKYPLETESAEAVRWLTRFYAGAETRRRIELGHFAMYQPAAWEAVPEAAVLQASAGAAFDPATKFRLRDPDVVRQWHQATLDLHPRLAAFGPHAVRDPAHVLALTAARRRLGLHADATFGLKLALANNPAVPPTDPWRLRLAEELRSLSADLEPDPAAPRLTARMTATKPYLDGHLTDACWTDAPASPLPHWAGVRDGGEYQTTVRMLTDAKFLYVGLTCGRPNADGLPTAKSGGRDDIMAGQDRVELRLDLDRGCCNQCRLYVDAAGRAADDCGGDATWNSRWFVAVRRNKSEWSAELAIPLAELTGAKVAGEVWGLNVVRTVPGVGAAGWAAPADADPRLVGHLRFGGKSKD